jgi:hypothetical protein
MCRPLLYDEGHLGADRDRAGAPRCAPQRGHRWFWWPAEHTARVHPCRWALRTASWMVTVRDPLLSAATTRIDDGWGYLLKWDPELEALVITDWRCARGRAHHLDAIEDSQPSPLAYKATHQLDQEVALRNWHEKGHKGRGACRKTTRTICSHEFCPDRLDHMAGDVQVQIAVNDPDVDRVRIRRGHTHDRVTRGLSGSHRAWDDHHKRSGERHCSQTFLEHDCPFHLEANHFFNDSPNLHTHRRALINLLRQLAPCQRPTGGYCSSARGVPVDTCPMIQYDTLGLHIHP